MIILAGVLQEAGIPEVVCSHIMEAISTNKICVQWKGEKYEYFDSKKRAKTRRSLVSLPFRFLHRQTFSSDFGFC